MKSQDPDQQRNLLLAVVLSMAVLLGWQLFYAGPKMKEEQARQRAQQELTQKQGATPDAAKPSHGSSGARRRRPGSGAARRPRPCRAKTPSRFRRASRSRRPRSEARSRCAAAASTTSCW